MRVPGYYSSTKGIQIAIRTSADASDDDLQFLQWFINEQVEEATMTKLLDLIIKRHQPVSSAAVFACTSCGSGGWC